VEALADPCGADSWKAGRNPAGSLMDSLPSPQRPPSGTPDPSLMRREIGEVPEVVERLLHDGAADTAAIANAVRNYRPRWVSVVARGTSDHAGVYARYLIETHLRLPVAMAAPSVTTIYRARPAWREALVLAVSQSGQSPDIVGVTEAARRGGALTISVTNDPTSPLARAAEHILPCHAGQERAVAATKTYVAQLAAIAGLVAALSPRGRFSQALPRLPEALHRSLAAGEAWVAGPAEMLAAIDRLLVVSRGYNLATAFEVALKLKETARIFAEGYSTADLLHGPVALATSEVPVLAFQPGGKVGPAIEAALARVRAKGSRTWEVHCGGPTEKIQGNAATLRLPVQLPEALTPLALVLPGQLLAEAVTRRRGLSPDEPSGLTKVTRTL
jgi:glutamine---fructose-6-phosphate transaminase (isomerizing)